MHQQKARSSFAQAITVLAMPAICACVTTPTPRINHTMSLDTCPQVVTMDDDNTAASIHFTNDGTAPTTNSTLYNGALQVNGPVNLTAMAVSANYPQSPPTSTAFNCLIAAPTFTPPASTVVCPPMVAIADATPATSILYSIDGDNRRSRTPLRSASRWARPSKQLASSTTAL